METATETARDRAGRLGKKIWVSVHPHAELPNPNLRRDNDNRPPAEVRLEEVTEPSQIKPGDVLLSFEDYDRRTLEINRQFAFHTVREAVQRYESVRVVESVSPKSIKVYESVHVPLGGWGSCDPEHFGEARSYNPDPVRYALPSGGRRLARLGTLEDIRARLQAHPDYAEWVSAYAEAKREEEAALERARAEREAKEARERPLKEAASRVNEIVGDPLFEINPFMGLSIEPIVRWLGEGDHLRVHLAGLLALGRITAEQHTEILGHLTTLGLNTDTAEEVTE